MNICSIVTGASTYMVIRVKSGIEGDIAFTLFGSALNTFAGDQMS